LSEPLAILTTVLPHVLQPGSLFFGEQARKLPAHALSRLLKLLPKLTGARLIRLSQSSLPSLFQQLPEFFTNGAVSFKIFAPKSLRLLLLSVGKVQLAKRARAHARSTPHHHPTSCSAALPLLHGRGVGGLCLLCESDHETAQHDRKSAHQNCEFLHLITPLTVK
jgi:hypothetical protein